jgi:hypothetical protein
LDLRVVTPEPTAFDSHDERANARTPERPNARTPERRLGFRRTGAGPVYAAAAAARHVNAGFLALQGEARRLGQ